MWSTASLKMTKSSAFVFANTTNFPRVRFLATNSSCQNHQQREMSSITLSWTFSRLKLGYSRPTTSATQPSHLLQTTASWCWAIFLCRIRATHLVWRSVTSIFLTMWKAPHKSPCRESWLEITSFSAFTCPAWQLTLRSNLGRRPRATICLIWMRTFCIQSIMSCFFKWRTIQTRLKLNICASMLTVWHARFSCQVWRMIKWPSTFLVRNQTALTASRWNRLQSKLWPLNK